MTRYVLSIDQGTTSTRAIVFDHSASIVASGQLEHLQHFPRAGWVEHDAIEIWDNVREAVGLALTRANLTHGDIAAVGLTNQRETTIVWQDTRTQRIVEDLSREHGVDRYKASVGLPLATYFAGPKVKWILDNVVGARQAADDGDLLFGTVDTWVLWNLTGGVEGGIHVTDVTNASRTMLMNLDTLAWDEQIVADMGIPMSMLPQIRSSSEVYGVGREHGMLPGVPIAGVLGDQQAAMFGQACFSEGMAKNTYGTGNFLLLNTGPTRVHSENGLLTTVCYKIGDAPAVYALEGSIAVTGSLVQWLRDNLGMFSDASEIEPLAREVEDNGGAYFVPAFSGLFAPYWRPDARGALLGLTRYVTTQHIARAALEATAYQTREVVEAMNADSGIALAELRVDGGMVANELLMQFQADQLGVDVLRPEILETTALGAAYAAGIAVGFWGGQDSVTENWGEAQRWNPSMPLLEREQLFRNWKKAVTKTMGWVDGDVDT